MHRLAGLHVNDGEHRVGPGDGTEHELVAGRIPRAGRTNELNALEVGIGGTLH